MSASNGAGLTLTPAQEFRLLREVGALVTLVSTGRVVRWRPVRVARLLREGKIPDTLTPQVMRMIWDSRDLDTRDVTQRAKDWYDYRELIVAAALLHPVVTTTPKGANEIHPDDLEPEEIDEIYDLAIAPLKEVSRFRLEPAEQVGTLADSPESDEIPQAAE